MQQLVDTLNEHCYNYHSLQRPTISDFEYDKMYRDLQAMEEKEGVVLEDSPTRRVGAPISGDLPPVRHQVKMRSLDNAFNDDDIHNFLVPIYNQFDNATLYLEPKFDGLAIKLSYNYGLLVQASTRGDGEVGEDVTDQVRTIKSVPLRLRKPHPSFLEVTGEVVMPKAVFQELNRQRREAGLKEFVNPRNAAAGSLRLEDSSETARRQLQFYPYGLGNVTRAPSRTTAQSGLHYWLWEMGFDNEAGDYGKICHTIEEAIEYYNAMLKMRHDLPFEIDGVVYKVNPIWMQDELGDGTRAPKWAVAHKFPADQAKSVVTSIRAQVGRTGAVTPVANIEPVFVGGVTVTSVTLHNQDEINRLDLREGDIVMVSRAGDVIPKILGVENPPDRVRAEPFVMPTDCPCCGKPIIKLPDEAVIRCSGSWLSCVGQRAAGLEHFGSREAMDIDGLGEVMIDKLLKLNPDFTPADLYRLDVATLIQLDGVKEKTAQNLLENIHKSKIAPLRRFLIALGIRHCNEGTAKRLANAYGSFGQIIHDALRLQDGKALEKVKDIGPATASSIYEFFVNVDNVKMLQEMMDLGVVVQDEAGQVTISTHLQGYEFVFTGTFGDFKRTALEQVARENGATVADSIKRSVTHLVVGEKPSSKVAKAADLGIKSINLEEFQRLVFTR